MPRINVLPKHIADLIAAGEVVERPSSVIKEFVENSIDAGATKIVVEIKNGGKTFLRVTDNGCGIDREDIKKAFISHATSKITSIEDLDAIATLGFRGEALASVCAVSKVEVLTATPDSDVGTRYVIEGGIEQLLDDAGCPTGTTIIVRDLFYNIPARMKFLKKDIQEGNYISSLLERIAVSNPGISFRFIRDDKTVFQTPGDGNLKSAIYAVFGKEFTENLIEVHNEVNGISVNGFVTKPIAGRGSRSMEVFFVNKRYVKSVVFMSALEAAYKNSIMTGKYPGCVLFVDMPFEAVDVNVHPAKTEVRFYDEKRIFDCVYYGVLGALNDDKSRVQASLNIGRAFIAPADKGEQLPLTAQQSDTSPTKSEKTEVKPISTQRSFIIKEFGSSTTDTSKVCSPKEEEKTLDFLSDEHLTPKTSKFTISSTPKTDMVSENTIPVDEKKEKTESIDESTPVPPVQEEVKVSEPEAVVAPVNFRLIGEAFNTYIIIELDNKLALIDKHAAHERILFEKFKNEGNQNSQFMLQPVIVTLSADEYSAVIDNMELLENAGYEVSDFGDKSVKVNACPPELSGEDISAVITEIAVYLSNNIKTFIPDKLDWIYHSMACRAAVKAGNFTSAYEAEKFVELLLSMDDIRYCPHGRPVLIELTKRELEKQFKRII